MKAKLAQLSISVAAALLGPRTTASEGAGIEIRSTPSKGLGAFATRDFAEGEYIGRYTGVCMTFSEAEAALASGDTSGDYFATLNIGPLNVGPLIVDAEDYQVSSWARFINHSRRNNCRNVELRQPLEPVFDGRVPLGLYVQSCRDINAGEELLIQYGGEYWDDRGFPMSNPRRWVIDWL